MESNENSSMASASHIDIVQSLMQDQGYLQEADFLNQPDVAASAAAAAKDDESSQTYAPEEFLSKPVASKVVSKKNDSSQSEFERLLNEDAAADSEDIVVSLSNESVTFLNKTTDEFDIVSKSISDKIGKGTEETINTDTSKRLGLALNNTSDASVKVAKGAAKDTLDYEPEPTKQDSAENIKGQSDTDTQAKHLDKETSDGIIQIANIVSQSSIAKAQPKSLEYESGKTNDKCRNSNTAETVTTDSLEAMLESLDGPAEPQVTECEGSKSSSNNNSIRKSIVATNTFVSKSIQALLDKPITTVQDDLIMMAVEEDAAPSNAAAAIAGTAMDGVTNTLGTDSPNSQDIDIKVELDSGDEVTFTDTFCEGPYNHDADTHYFKMFECKMVTIDLHDIIKSESARDAKAGLYKPSERKSIDIIRKEYKTKAMQDYIRKAKRMKLPEEKSIPRYTAKDKNHVVPMCLVYPVKQINSLSSRNSSTKSSNKPQIPKTISRKRNVEARSKKLLQDDYVYDSFDDDYDDKYYYQPSKKSSKKAQIPKKHANKRNVEIGFKKQIQNNYVSDILDGYHLSNKSSNKAQIPKGISRKQNSKVGLKKQIQESYVGDILDNGYHPSNKSSPKAQIPKEISRKKFPKIRFKKQIQDDYVDDIFDDDDDEDYQPPDTAANYTCFDCMEGFETNAELKVHKRMEHNQSTSSTQWKTPVKAAPKKKRVAIPSYFKSNRYKRETIPSYFKSNEYKRVTIPSYFKSNQYRIDGINGMKSIMGLKPSIANLNKEDMIQGANMVYNQNTFYNHELGKNISDQEMYHHMMKKYTIKVAQLCIGANRFSSYYQLAKKAPTDSLQTKISTVTVDRGHVLITSPLLHW